MFCTTNPQRDQTPRLHHYRWVLGSVTYVKEETNAHQCRLSELQEHHQRDYVNSMPCLPHCHWLFKSPLLLACRCCCWFWYTGGGGWHGRLPVVGTSIMPPITLQQATSNNSQGAEHVIPPRASANASGRWWSSVLVGVLTTRERYYQLQCDLFH